MSELFEAEYTIDMQIEEVEREIGMRVNVYRRRVSEGKMSSRKADDQIGVMRAVRQSLERLKQIEKVSA